MKSERPLNIVLKDMSVVNKLSKKLKEVLTGSVDQTENFRKTHLQPAIIDGLIELTLADKPNSSKQKYRLTEKAHLQLSK